MNSAMNALPAMNTLKVMLAVMALIAVRTDASARRAPDADYSFDEDFSAFDYGTDQIRPEKPHRWRTVYGYGGALSVWNRQMSETSFASDPGFAGVTANRSGSNPLHLDPFAHRQGELTILAQRVPEKLRPLVWNKPYYGGAITTRFSFSQLFGYFEIEARLPAGKGMWPAFWLLPIHGGNWPDAGEIDVFEGLGDPRSIHCTVIYGKDRKNHEKIALPFDSSRDFHRYGVLWKADEIVWYVDRKPVARAPTPAALRASPMYLIANLAVGGSWGGQPDASTIFPGRYTIRRIAAWPLGRQPVDL